MRFRTLSLILALVTVLALAACGSDSAEEPAAPASSTEKTTDTGSFPATVEHEFGTTTVPSEPKRIVSVGYTEQDTLLALGRKPVGVTEWYGEHPYATWPWAQKLLGDAKPTVLSITDGFEFEKIAALKPDLIVGTNAGMEKGDYEKLSKLAPTIASGKGAPGFFSPWDDQTLLIAAALGIPDRGRQLVADVRAKFAKAQLAHPEFKGKTATFTQNAFYDGLIYTYPAGLNTEFLTYLGFTIKPELTPLQKKVGEQVTLSPERVDLLDADLMLFATEKPSDVAALDNVPTFRRIDGIKKNRAVFTDGTLAGAIYFISPLSLPYTLDRLLPQIEKAMEGKAPHRVIDTTGR